MARKPKLQVTVKPETQKALQEYADALNVSLSAATGRLLDEAAPSVLDLAHALQKLPEAPARAIREAAQMVHKATRDADQILMELDPPKKKKRA